MLIHFHDPGLLGWLWLVPAVAGLHAYGAARRRRALRAFGGAPPSRRWSAAAADVLAVALAVLALARPAWDPQEVELGESGRHVVFLLDVSRSMLAEDMYPNRLENAKTAILDCVEGLSGDRVALVLFAGSAEIRCPPTTDYDYFRMVLRQASPESVSVGGTSIANALEKVLDKLADPAKAGLQDLVLVTDGEETVEGPDEIGAARKLAEAGMRLVGIGIGDRARGSRIALETGVDGGRSFLRHGHSEVWTRLRSETLRGLAAAAPGNLYFEVADGPFDLARIYRQVMEQAPREATGGQVVVRHKEKAHLFLSAAVAVLLASRGRGGRPRALLLCGAWLLAGGAQADAPGLFREGVQAYREGRFDEAATAFGAAADRTPGSAETLYNLGNARYRADRFDEAAAAFGEAAALATDGGTLGRCLYNLGNSLVRSGDALRGDDPAAALRNLRDAATAFRAALDYRPDLADAAYNLEVANRLAAGLEEQLREDEQRARQEDDLIQYIREKLEEFIERQSRLIDDRQTGEPQRTLEREVRALAEVMEGSGLHAEIVLPDGTRLPGPLAETYGHTVEAADAMAKPDPPAALAALQAALGAAPTAPDGQEGDPDGNGEEPGDPEMDYDFSDADADLFDQADPFGDFSDYEEIRGLPPPNRTEMDILAEEIRNQEQRKEQRAGAYKPVEKDW